MKKLDPFPTDPTPPARRRARRRRSIAWTVVGLALVALAFLTDPWTMEGTQRLRSKISTGDWRARSAGENELLNKMELYARAAGTTVIALLILCLDRRRRARVFALVLAVFFASMVNHVVKRATGRMRPYAVYERADAYRTFFGGPAMGLRQSRYQSFTSGHTVSATAQTVALAQFYPPAAPVFYGLLVIVGVERVYHEKHFLSDVLGAVLLAFFLTRWLLANGPFQRLCVFLAQLRPFRFEGERAQDNADGGPPD